MSQANAENEPAAHPLIADAGDPPAALDGAGIGGDGWLSKGNGPAGDDVAGPPASAYEGRLTRDGAVLATPRDPVLPPGDDGGPTATDDEEPPKKGGRVDKGEGPTMSREEKWEARFKQLVEFQEEHGHCDVNQLEGEFGRWVKKQRYLHTICKLREDRTERLEGIGFTFPRDEDRRRRQAVPWEERFEQLAQFHQERGHCKVPYARGQLKRWVDRQREAFRTNDLTDEHVARLRSIGFDMNSARVGPRPANVAVWEERYQQLLRFHEEHGHFMIPVVDSKSKGKLRNWVDRQRDQFRRGNMTDDRISRLRAAGFDLEGGQQLGFERGLEQLCRFKEVHGHLRVPLNDPVLGRWVWHQVNDYKKMKLSDHHIEVLEIMGFEWQLSWQERLVQLEKFRQKTGSCHVPRDHVVLGKWAHDQREAHKKGEVSPERVALLQGMGFVLRGTRQRTTPQGRVGWEQRCEQLRQYKLENGHCNAPRSHPQLGNWVDNQRRSFKKGSLSGDRITALREMGFNFGSTKKLPEVQWEEQFARLVQYRRERGDCNVRQASTGLGQWVHWQRCVRKKGKLSEERIARLDGIGFSWRVAPVAPVACASSRETLSRRRCLKGMTSMTFWEKLRDKQQYKEMFGIALRCFRIPNEKGDGQGIPLLNYFAFEHRVPKAKANGTAAPKLKNSPADPRRNTRPRRKEEMTGKAEKDGPPEPFAFDGTVSSKNAALKVIGRCLNFVTKKFAHEVCEFLYGPGGEGGAAANRGMLINRMDVAGLLVWPRDEARSVEVDVDLTAGEDGGEGTADEPPRPDLAEVYTQLCQRLGRLHNRPRCEPPRP